MYDLLPVGSTVHRMELSMGISLYQADKNVYRQKDLFCFVHISGSELRLIPVTQASTPILKRNCLPVDLLKNTEWCNLRLFPSVDTPFRRSQL